MAYPGIKVSTAEARAIYPRNTVVRIASATAAIWPALSMPATPGSRSWPPN